MSEELNNNPEQTPSSDAMHQTISEQPGATEAGQSLRQEQPIAREQAQTEADAEAAEQAAVAEALAQQAANATAKQRIDMYRNGNY